MKNYEWLARDTVLAIHREQLAQHGGSSGLRDMGLLESALAKPINLAAYGERDLARLAAAYAIGIAKNHPFIDGNKRTAFVAAVTFLAINGAEFDADEVDAAVTFLRLAAGEIAAVELADWIRKNIK